MSMSIIASELAFSVGRCVRNEKRSKMTGKIVEMLLCFKDWLDVKTRFHDRGRYDTRSNDEDDTNGTDN